MFQIFHFPIIYIGIAALFLFFFKTICILLRSNYEN